MNRLQGTPSGRLDVTRIVRLSLLIVAAWAASGAGAVATDAVDADEQFLRDSGVGVQDADLLAYLKQRSGSDDDLLRMDALIRRLGSAEFQEREDAARRLTALGPCALDALRKAASDSDAELRRRARSCTDEINGAARWGVSTVVVRRLVKRKAEGAVEGLLRYLPYEIDEAGVEEVVFGLDQLTREAGKVNAALFRALEDKVTARRAASACVVGRRGDERQRAAVEKLYRDSAAVVRLRAAQGLLVAGHKSAVPVLIALLNERSVEVTWQAEELLHWVAGDGAPSQTIGAGEEDSRLACRKAWEGWWRDHGREMDVAKLWKECRRPGLVLVCEQDKKEQGRVWLCGCDGKPRWQLVGSSDCGGMQLLPGADRILFPSAQQGYYDGQKRQMIRFPSDGWTERDLKGRVLWKHESLDVWAVQRLPNGNLFFIDPKGAYERMPDGGEVYHTPPFRHEEGFSYDFKQRLANGRLLCIWNGPRDRCELAEFEGATGRRWRKIPLQDTFTSRIYRVEATPEGGFLLPLPHDRQVLEIDAAGKTVRRHRFLGSPWHAFRLRNGNTLVAGGGPAGGVLVELTPNGATVWEVLTDSLNGLNSVSPCLGLVRLGFDVPRPAGIDLSSSVSYRVQGLKSKDPVVRIRAAKYLVELGPKAEEAVPPLLEALDDPDEMVGALAAGALAKVGPDILPELLRAAKDKRPMVRAWVAYVLGGFEKRSKPAVPTLIEMTRDEDVRVRRRSVWALGRIGPEARAALPALLVALKDCDVRKNRREQGVADAAAIALAWVGADAELAIPALLETLQTKEVELQITAVSVLNQFGPDGAKRKIAVLPLVKVLEDKTADPRLRATAASALGTMGAPHALDAISALEKALKDPDESIRNVAANALAKIRP